MRFREFWRRFARARPDPRTDMLAPGTSIQEWKVLRHLGEGRHGALYEVERAGHRFVLKWLSPSQKRPSPERLEALAEREAACLRLLRGPLFVGLEAQGRWPEEEHGSPFLVLQAVEGMSFTRWSHQHGPTFREMVHVFLGVTTALAEMHRKGVRYPSLAGGDFTVRKDRLEPVLTDLGGAFPGWGPLKSEEVAEDINATGALLYHALTRQPPGPNAPPPHLVNPRVPRKLSELTMRLLDPWPSPDPRV
jgi:serine/threonine-protein kinase